jgi:hypothetical protein
MRRWRLSLDREPMHPHLDNSREPSSDRLRPTNTARDKPTSQAPAWLELEQFEISLSQQIANSERPA